MSSAAEPHESEAATPEERLTNEIGEALEAGDGAAIERIFSSLHHADQADVLGMLDGAQRAAVLDALGSGLRPEVLPELDPALRTEVVEYLGPERAAAGLQRLDTEKAVELLEDLPQDVAGDLLARLSRAQAEDIQSNLAYPEGSAGRLLNDHWVAVDAGDSIAACVEAVRRAGAGGEDHYDVCVLRQGEPVGTIPVSRLVTADGSARAGELASPLPAVIDVTMDQERVAHMFRDYDFVTAPVVDEGGKFVGVITVGRVLDVLKEETEEDMLNLGGVSRSDFFEPLAKTVRRRSYWLTGNLLTALLAAWVISWFEAALERVVALAILMPIVAAMGGNAGTQSLTITVRALAMEELQRTNAGRMLGKELIVGLANGVLIATLAGLAAGFWFDSPMLGGIIAAALLVTLALASVVGFATPFSLSRIGIDPALSSGVVLTITDIVAFFSFLGLATALYLA